MFRLFRRGGFRASTSARSHFDIWDTGHGVSDRAGRWTLIVSQQAQIQASNSHGSVASLLKENRRGNDENARRVARRGASVSTLLASAQSYPSRPITVVVPFAAGGGTDTVTRILAEHMSRKLGQSIIVEDVIGAGGTIGSQRIARAAPDGYRLLMGNLGTHAASIVLYPNRGYDPSTISSRSASSRRFRCSSGKKSLPITTSRASSPTPSSTRRP